MSIRIALAGNPNSGKTTLFNALTGSNQYVGNWPGVTVEKKEGKLKKHSDATVTDLPGIYSLSPYTIEEVVARDYLIDEKPDAVLNIVDGTNLERNLYLTTQIVELGIPVVVAVNMMDVVRKRGDKIDVKELSRQLACPVVEISALKGDGVDEAAELAVKAAQGAPAVPQHSFSGVVEHALAHIEERLLHNMPAQQQRWYAIKLFEGDEKVIEKLQIPEAELAHIREDIEAAETELDDDAESIITNERYVYIGSIIQSCYKKAKQGQLSTSDKIDRVVTNRILGLPIFVVIMFLVYTISMAPSAFGTGLTDWANDGLFGDGWHLWGGGKYEAAMDDYAAEYLFSNEEFVATLDAAVAADVAGAEDIRGAVEDGSWADFEEPYDFYADSLAEAGYDISDYVTAAMGDEDEGLEPAGEIPAPEDYGVWVPGIPVLIGNLLEKIGANDFVSGLILDGIVAGVGAVLGFVPQMLVLFLCLAFLESCGYMARVAFIMDRIFRKFGLSGKSFIPVLVGTGCGVPGIMASRTIENERDRRMTIMTTTFIPCGAKLPIITMIATALFHGSPWVATSAYFIGIAAIICSGILLKKTKMFAGDPAPFVMELPAYHLPTVGTVLRSMWERGWSFIKKAGTIILLSSIVVWLGSVFGTVDGRFGFDPDMELESSVLGMVANVAKFIFAPLGFGTGLAGIKATIATVMGLVAKEEVVGVFGVLDFEGLTRLAAYSFLLFNLLCAPCFAAIGAIKREMNSAKWTWFAIGYQCALAYAVSLCVYQIGSVFTGNLNVIGLICAVAVLAGFCYLLFRKNKYDDNHLTVSAKHSK